MKKLIALLLILSTPAYAGNATKVHTGDVVTKEYNEGTLLDKEQAEKIRDQLIERDGFEKENKSYQKSIELYKSNEVIYLDQKDMLLKQNIELTRTLNDQRSTNTLTIIAYIVVGAGGMYLATKAASSLK